MDRPRIVPPGDVVRLSRRYDATARASLWRRFAAEHEKFTRLQGRRVGRDDFAAHIDEVIAKYMANGGVIASTDQSSDHKNFNAVSVSSKSFDNFLSADPTSLSGFQIRILSVVEAYLLILGARIHDSGEGWLPTIGRGLVFQYRPPDLIDKVPYPVGAYRFDGTEVIVPGPVDASFVILWLEAIEGEEFLYCRVIPVARPAGFSRLDNADFDKSNWHEDHFTGLAVVSKDGIGCHLTSLNAKIPLYVLVKRHHMSSLSQARQDIGFAFIGYESPGYLLDYAAPSVLLDENIIKLIKDLPMVI